jgi:hypothetical protein
MTGQTIAAYNPPGVETRSSSNSVHLPLGFFFDGISDQVLLMTMI